MEADSKFNLQDMKTTPVKIKADNANGATLNVKIEAGYLSETKQDEMEVDNPIATEGIAAATLPSIPDLGLEDAMDVDLDAPGSVIVPTLRLASTSYHPEAKIAIKKEPQDGVVPRPSKRQRSCFIDAVVDPSFAALGIKRARNIPTKNSRSTRIPPPIKKIKKLERSEGLGAGTLSARLVAAGIGAEPYPIALGADIKDVSVRRDFMRIHYGGSSQEAFPPISRENYTRTGHRYFMYPNLVQNPDAPMIPGAPGLFLDASGRSAQECDAKWASGAYNLKVLTRLGVNDNLYMGDYAIRPAESLTRAEWAAQTPAVCVIRPASRLLIFPTQMRNRWCNQLANLKKDLGRETRTRISLRRRLGRNPTFAEVDFAIENDQKFGYITADDIAQAFENGDERLAVWTMKCIGYDEQFQRDLPAK
ncbi:hypothetical protein B0H17DRAFT_258439 [Mycena rosella]|uniref:DUF6697 domain-containing protein n=1 Tax=Mycena rosella TaxID=1033263 RepID=A0AAD7CW36_MYCRO|nr:hypothetical protein B0H17DRAFT_258439 [Mycena rosella]